MVPYSVQCRDITCDHELLFRTIEEILWSIDNEDKVLTCHEVCEHIIKDKYFQDTIKILRLNVVHRKGGFTKRGYQHSWLELPDDEVIIDVYPWCASGPFMVTTKGLLNPWKHLYIEAEINIPKKEEFCGH